MSLTIETFRKKYVYSIEDESAIKIVNREEFIRYSQKKLNNKKFIIKFLENKIIGTYISN